MVEGAVLGPISQLWFSDTQIIFQCIFRVLVNLFLLDSCTIRWRFKIGFILGLSFTNYYSFVPYVYCTVDFSNLFPTMVQGAGCLKLG